MGAGGFDDWDDDERSDGSRRKVVGAVAAAAGLALAWLVVVPALRDDGGGEAVTLPAGTPASGTDAQPLDDGSVVATSTTVSVESSAPRPTTSLATTQRGSTTTDAAATTGTDDPTGPPAPTVDPAPTSSPSGGATYPTLPDGSPVPVVAIFDVDTITLSGTVPSEAAAERLKTLALANSKTPASIVEFLAIDPTVPASVPVRVIELTSTRFPEGSADVLAEHARELDRVATVMTALPNVTVLVVGHADQRGDELTNFELSEARAQAVVRYLAGQGIEPSRLSSRAVGETDLLVLADDETALALNRRTEFVFSGLLLGA
jgi:outer membrane protein OmpA-like peptidoglycan-associated protein